MLLFVLDVMINLFEGLLSRTKIEMLPSLINEPRFNLSEWANMEPARLESWHATWTEDNV